MYRNGEECDLYKANVQEWEGWELYEANVQEWLGM